MIGQLAGRGELAAARGATDPGFDHDMFARQMVLFLERTLEVRP